MPLYPKKKGVIRLFYSLDDSIRSPAYRYKARSSILNGLMMLAVDRNTLQAAGSLLQKASLFYIHMMRRHGIVKGLLVGQRKGPLHLAWDILVNGSAKSHI